MMHLALPTDIGSRLRAWWNGTEPHEVPEDVAALAAGLDRAEPTREDWPPERIAAVQMVCGDGSTIPGGGHFAKQSLRYVGLNGQTSVVDYGARLGLFGRVAAKTAGAWVDACEPDPALLEAARQLTRGRHLSKKVTFHGGDLLDAPIQDRHVDVVLVVGTMHRSADRGEHLANIARMLKPGGRMLIIDFFRETKAASTPAIEQWRQVEALPDTLPRLEHAQMALRRLHTRVTMTQDITDEYCANLTKGLKRLARQIRQHPPESAMHTALLREVEFWGARLHVLKSGDVSVLRLLAARPQSG
jgi:SAM-dependent methyltransferase